MHALEQVVRRHRRTLVDRALGSAPSYLSSASPTTAETSISSPLVSSDGFHTVVKRFEKLCGFTAPREVSELIYGDAYLVALGLSRRREVKKRFCLTW